MNARGATVVKFGLACLLCLGIVVALALVVQHFRRG